MKDKVFNQ